MTRACNAENERLKRRYFGFLREAKQHSEATIDCVASALAQFEQYNKQRSFRMFRIEQAVGFKDHLLRCRSNRSTKPLSKATVYSTLMHLRAFFQWLSREPGFKARISYSDAEYFNLSLKDSRAAKASAEARSPTIEQVYHVLKAMPARSEIEMRDRALVAFTLLTGARDNAIASLKMKHIDLDRRRLFQDGKEVRTKFAKTIVTFFFPVGEDVLKIVFDWVAYLMESKQWGREDPLFPATKVGLGDGLRFGPQGLERRCWSSAAAIRKIFRQAFEQAGLPYFHPHSFRKTLALLGQQVCQSPEEFKAWSQNLGHEDVLTTFTSYGRVAEKRQAELIATAGFERVKPSASSLIEGLVDLLARHKTPSGSVSET